MESGAEDFASQSVEILREAGCQRLSELIGWIRRPGVTVERRPR